MPAFMAVSGWVACKSANMNAYGSFLSRRFRQLMIPYFLWSIISCIIKGYEAEKIITQPDCYFWFLWVLFFICVLFYGSRMIASRCNTNELVIILAVSSILMGVMVFANVRTFGFQFIAYYFLFYTLGYFIHKNSCLHIKSGVILLVLSVLWVILAWWWKMHELPSWMPVITGVPVALLQYAYRGFTALLAILVIMNVAPRFLSNQHPFNTLMAKIGKVSLGIYVIHLLLMSFIIDGVKMLNPEVSLYILVTLSAIISFFVSICIVAVLNKWEITSRFLLGKLY